MDEITVESALKFLGNSGKKYVPESDLIAAKKGLEERLSGVQGELATSKSDLDSRHQDVLNAQAALKEAEGKLSTLSGSTGKSAEEVKALKQQLQEAVTSRDGANKVLADLRCLAIHQASDGKISMEDLGKKTPEQLESLEEALKLVGTGKGQTFDGGGGGTGGGGKQSGRSLIKEGLKARG